MALLLGIDTSSMVKSIALVEDERLLAELTINTKKPHSELLLEYIAELLKMAEKTKAELTGIVVNLGPGSFTGLRIGLAVAKAMAVALNIDLLGVDSLRALAYNLPLTDKIIVPLVDAQKERAYYAYYRWGKGQIEEVQPLAIANVAELLPTLGEEYIFLGDMAVKKMVKGLVPLHRANASASSLIVAAKGTVPLDPDTAQPIYVRQSEAEELWEKRHGKGS